MAKRLQLRRDTEANWASVNPTLLQGEIGYVLDAAGNVIGQKVGNGVTSWRDLPFFTASDGSITEAKLSAEVREKLNEPEINNAEVSVSNTTGAPSATAEVVGDTLKLQFNGIKGERGETANIHIQGYVNVVGELPTGAAIGTVYGVKDAEFTEENPKYRVYVYTSSGWVDNGLFGGISAGVVQETGDGENVVMSQKAVSEEILSLKGKVLSNDIITISEEDFTIRGMYSSSDGAYSANENRLLTPFIRVNAGDELSVFKIQQGTEQLALIAFDSEKNILLDKCKVGRWIYESYNYKIDDEVAYLRFGRTLDTECSIQNRLSRSIHEYIPNKIEVLSQDTVTNNNYVKRVEKSVVLVNLVDNVEDGTCINSEGYIVSAIAEYKVSKFYAKGGMYSIESPEPGTQRALWMYTDDTYTTPKLELFGNTSIDCNIALSEGYYAIGWKGEESALVISTENINTLDSVDSYVIAPSMGTENVRLYLDNGVFTEVANNYRVSTGYIPVFKGQRLIRSNYKSENEYNIAFYSKPSFDGFTRLVTASNHMMPVVEENEHYIRICCAPSDTKTTTITAKKDSYAEKYLGLDSAISKVGNDMASKHVDTLSDAELLFDNFPNGLKKGHTFSLFGKVVEFSRVSIGFGQWGSYKSHIEVDNDNVYLVQKDNIVKTIKHELSITEFIKVIGSSGNDGVLNIIVSTLGGVFKTEIPEWGYGINGTPFVSADSHTTLTDVTVSFGNKDFGESVWCFGDSYYHVDIDAGVMRWLKEYGVFDNILVMGYGGCNAARAYDDFVKCLSYGTPKYVVWSEGLNDNYGTWLPYYNTVVEVCANKGIELILQTIPNVRHSSYIEQDAISFIVKNSGYRYIDAAKAVGANNEGEWYGNGSSNDYQSTDNVHPTALGAKAIATQWLVDFHEIMQY